MRNGRANACRRRLASLLVALGPETLLGAEAGFDLGVPGASLEATAFVSRLDHPIVNVTVGPNHQMRASVF